MAPNEINLLTERVVGAVFEVSNSLGAGFLEKVYEKALLREMGIRGVRAESVEREVLVELKCAERLGNEHTAQCMNYLKASGLSVCLLVNFQRPRVEWKRIVLGFRG